MDRINYPTQESVIVGHGNKYPLHQTNIEVGVYGVLVRLVSCTVYCSCVIYSLCNDII